MLPVIPINAPTRSIATVVDDDHTISFLLEELLDRSGLTFNDLANRLGITPQSLHQYRSGVRTNPGIKWLAKVANVCGAKLIVEFPNRPIKDPNEAR